MHPRVLGPWPLVKQHITIGGRGVTSGDNGSGSGGGGGGGDDAAAAQ